MTLTPPITGHCLCGATRYRIEAAPLWTANCHCAFCRRATGAGFGSYLAVPEGSVTWEGPERLSHSTSPGVFWDRCATCGSPLSYRAPRWPGEVQVHAGTLDHAEDFVADEEVSLDEHLDWVELAAPPPHQMRPGDDPAPVLALIRAAFAGMEGRIDPPSSMHRLTEDDIRLQAAHGEVWLIGMAPLACMFLTLKPHALYIGKLATAAQARNQGHARRLIAHAVRRAHDLGLPLLELQTRVELAENHAAFRAMGFEQVAETRHPGFDRTTSLTFQRKI